MADFTGGNAGSRIESNESSAEFGNEAMSCENLSHNSNTASPVEHENSACLFNVNDHTSVLQKVKLEVGESERNDVSAEEESAVVGNDGVEDKNEIVTNGAVENGEMHSGNGSVPFQNDDLNLDDGEISMKDEILEEENGVLDIENNNKGVKDVCDAGNELEESGMKNYEHQAVETEKVETDNINGRSLEREEDETLADEAEGAELKENMNSKVELEPEQEEKAKSESASENGEVVTFADADKLDHTRTDSNTVMKDNAASGEAESPKPVKEEPVKRRSWRDIAVDGMESIPDKVQFRSRNPTVRRSAPKIVKSVVRSGDLNSIIESNVFVTKCINEALSGESVSDTTSTKGSTNEEKPEQVAEQDCKLKFEAEKGNSNNVVADLFSKSKGSDVGLKNINISTIAGIDKEEQVKENKRKKERVEKARQEEELRKKAEEEKRREEEATKERLRKEEEATELRKKLVDEEMEKMRMAEERKKKKKAAKAQKRAEYKAQKEAEEKEKKKAKKQRKKSGTSDTSSVSSEKSTSSPEKNSPDASSHDPESSRSAVLKRPVVLASSKKKVNVPKDPPPLPLALRNRSKRKWLKGTMWSLLLVSAVLMLFMAGNYVSSESLFQGFTF